MSRPISNNLSKLSEETAVIQRPDFWGLGAASWRARTPEPHEEETSDTPIQPSLVVTPVAHQEFMTHNRLYEVLEGLLEGIDATRTEELERVASKIRGIFHAAPIPEPLGSHIYQSCQRLGVGFALVWPIIRPYDKLWFSRGYKKRPYLEASTPEGVMKAIKTWWASPFDAAAVHHYWESKGPSYQEAAITVVAQQRLRIKPTSPLFPTRSDYPKSQGG